MSVVSSGGQILRQSPESRGGCPCAGKESRGYSSAAKEQKNEKHQTKDDGITCPIMKRMMKYNSLMNRYSARRKDYH